MSRVETKLRTIRYLQRGATAGFNLGADCGREGVRAAVVAVTLLSLIAAFAAPAIALERSICQSDISASEPTPQAKPAVAADPLAHGAPEATAILPSLDSIEAQTDITVFLQSCVPAELRLAALRRAWTVDPAIRDFKELSENDWDFNNPNSIVGFGELGPEVDVNIMVAQILGEPLRLAARPLVQLEEPRRTFSSLANAVWHRFLGVTPN